MTIRRRRMLGCRWADGRGEMVSKPIPSTKCGPISGASLSILFTSANLDVSTSKKD